MDDTGMFVVIKLRATLRRHAKWLQIRKGNLRSFSIGGQAFERVNKSDQTRGDYREIRRMELHEVTICEKGINPEAQFRILKEDNGENMTNTMSELQSVLERLSKKLDEDDKNKDKKDKESKDKALSDLLDTKDVDDSGNTEESLMDAREDDREEQAET